MWSDYAPGGQALPDLGSGVKGPGLASDILVPTVCFTLLCAVVETPGPCLGGLSKERRTKPVPEVPPRKNPWTQG